MMMPEYNSFTFFKCKNMRCSINLSANNYTLIIILSFHGHFHGTWLRQLAKVENLSSNYFPQCHMYDRNVMYLSWCLVVNFFWSGA